MVREAGAKGQLSHEAERPLLHNGNKEGVDPEISSFSSPLNSLAMASMVLSISALWALASSTSLMECVLTYLSGAVSLGPTRDAWCGAPASSEVKGPTPPGSVVVELFEQAGIRHQHVQ